MISNYPISKSIQAGFSLMELMITIAIIGVLSAVAIPAYNGYIEVSRHGVALSNAESLAGFARTYYYEYDTHPVGVYVPGGADTLRTELDWNPQGDNAQFKYAIVACDGFTKTQCVYVTATSMSDINITQTVTISP